MCRLFLYIIGNAALGAAVGAAVGVCKWRTERRLKAAQDDH